MMVLMQSPICVVFNLCNGVDVEATRERMEHYRRDHQTLIMKNRDKQVYRNGAVGTRKD